MSILLFWCHQVVFFFSFALCHMYITVLLNHSKFKKIQVIQVKSKNLQHIRNCKKLRLICFCCSCYSLSNKPWRALWRNDCLTAIPQYWARPECHLVVYTHSAMALSHDVAIMPFLITFCFVCKDLIYLFTRIHQIWTSTV